MSDKMRITGMASGLDVDNMVKQMMKPYNMRIDKVKQDRQKIQWQQDLYRDIIGDLTTFRSTYFDTLKSDTNMLFSSSYVGFDVSSVNAVSASESSPVTATAIGTGVVEGAYKVEVTNLAGSATLTGNVLKDASGKSVNYSTMMSDINSSFAGDTINIKFNGGNAVALKINASDTISGIINKINTITSGNVTAKYSELTGKFSLATTKTGIDSTLEMDKDISILGVAAPRDTVSGAIINTHGQNAKLKITPPGGTAIDVEKAANTFAIDGISYNLVKSGTANISVTGNTQIVFDKIKTFITKYNEIVDKINKKVDERKQYSYKPLTDEQKSTMKEEEIKKWEDKAKEGLLKSDSMLNGLLSSMRCAFFQGVEGAGISLKELGLSTSRDTSQRGKIIFDDILGGEQKLKDAIKTRGPQVANLFMKTSTKQPQYDPDLTAAQWSDRNSDEGIFQRINDIMQNYVRTTRNNKGYKGLLLEKAGIKGDFTEFNNILFKQLGEKDKVISDLTSKLSEREERYYLQFSKLEQAMNKMNSQSNWLAQQLGGGK